MSFVARIGRRVLPRAVGAVGSTAGLSRHFPRSHAPMPTVAIVAARFYSTPPHQIITMPALSPTMETGNVASWSIAVGDEVTAGDVLAEIETDKAVMEFEAIEDGYLAKIFVKGGAKDIKVGVPLCIIAESADDIAALANVSADAPTSATEKPTDAAPAMAPTSSTPSPTPHSVAPAQTSQPGGRIIASPIAKVIALAKGIDLANVTGTGAGGRIVKDDVEAFAARAGAPVAPTSVAPAVAPIGRDGNPYNDLELTMMRKTIAKRLTDSHQTIPMFYTTMDIRMDNIISARKALNDMGSGEYKISVNDFVIKASAQALLKVPQANSSWQGSFIRQYSHADISVAVSTPAGLITPIVFDADNKGLVEINNDVKTLAALAKDNKLQPEQFMGGTFSVSNMGMYGVNEFTAIVNPPQACILAVAGVQKVLVPGPTADSAPVTANVMKVTLTADHRVVDGAVAAEWLNAFKFYMEDPRTLLLH